MGVKTRFAGLLAMLVLLAISSSGTFAAEAKIWHVKAVHPEGRLLDVKALDKQGNIFDVKALEQDGNRHLLDVKAFVSGKTLPVKILVCDDKYAPVKAIPPQPDSLDGIF